MELGNPRPLARFRRSAPIVPRASRSLDLDEIYSLASYTSSRTDFGAQGYLVKTPSYPPYVLPWDLRPLARFRCSAPIVPRACNSLDFNEIYSLASYTSSRTDFGAQGYCVKNTSPYNTFMSTPNRRFSASYLEWCATVWRVPLTVTLVLRSI